MQSVQLSATGAMVSALCLGTDYYGSRTPTRVARQLLDEFAESGGTFVDTANIYACWIPGFVGGESETVIGDWMADRRNRASMFVATKVAGPYQDVPQGLRAVDIQRECDKSLHRLRTDVIDLYYAHVDDRNTPLEEIVGAFHRLVESGKVRFVGVSNWHTWRLAEARLLTELRAWTQLAALEFRYSYLRPVPGADFGDQVAADSQLLDYARTHGLTLVAYSTLLNGAYSRVDRELPPEYQGPDADARLTVLKEVAAEAGITPNQAVLAWLRQADQPVIPIIGGSTLDQLRENLAATDVLLTSDQRNRLHAAGATT
jgi:aryl-alcohol dehydrogenase-like predicted oxidoreductase